jgi:hypothetical protein
MSGVSRLQATKNALLEALKTSAEQQRKIEDLQATLRRTQDAYVEALQEAGVWDANLGIVASIQAMAAEIEDLSGTVFSLKIQLRTVSRAFEERLEREKSE